MFWLPISEKLFYKLLIGLCFQWFLYNQKNNQMFSIFADFAHTEINIINLYQNELLRCFSEDIKIWLAVQHTCI